MRNLVIIAHDIRSTHNVGSLLRTAEGLGVDTVWLTGYTPYPTKSDDERLPHLSEKITKQISKTALGAETQQPWHQSNDVLPVISQLKQAGYQIIALEQSETSVELPKYKPSDKIALLIGREVEGVDQILLDQCDLLLEIPMFGQKESFNVVQAAAMALYHFRFN